MIINLQFTSIKKGLADLVVFIITEDQVVNILFVCLLTSERIVFMSKMIKKITKSESGQAIVLVALAMVVILGFAAIAIDFGSVALQKSDLQDAADAAALAGAGDLSNPSTARNSAITYAGQNGMKATQDGVTKDGDTITVTTPYNGDSTKIKVECKRTVTYTLAQVLGFNSTTVTASAVAQTGNLGSIFSYTLFSGSENTTTKNNGCNLTVNGNAHSNYRWKINGSNTTIKGTCEAVSEFRADGSNINITTLMASPITNKGSNFTIGTIIKSSAPVVEMPDFSAQIISQATAAGQAYVGNKKFSGKNINVDSPIYVDGNVSISGCNFSGKGCILATGDITFSGTNVTNITGDAVCFYSANGNIKITGSNANLNEILYAPNGDIKIAGTNLNIKGRVIGNTVTFSGSNLTITSGTSELQSLPSGEIKLVE